MEATEENGTKIPSWEQQFEEIRGMVDKLGTLNGELEKQRDSALNLLEHAQRELALALIRIEELEGKTTRKDDEEANRYA